MKKVRKFQRFLFPVLISATINLLSAGRTVAQNKSNYIRIAKIVVDSAQLDTYKAALKEGVETAVQKEPGVLMLYAVYAKEHPTQVTVFEIYKDEEAYKTHIQTPHFKKYKNTVATMVKSLELTDVAPIAMKAKQNH
ncbi:MAG: antibiotic biosynthesis monooxygenase [Bacteroidetes bacterium]|nr:antibiotic biosynthesis monooxygenase [Bacteroidota bacterium]